MRHGKRDKNHADIVAWYRALGCSVFDLADRAGGCPDLLVGFAKRTFLVEVKDKNGRLTKKQKEFMANWRGSEITVVRDQEDVKHHVETVRGLMRYEMVYK